MHLIVILLLFSALCSPILCQNKKYAIVSNNGLNGKSDRNKIEFLTTLLKKESSTNGIIILGDVVSTHSLDDLGEFQSFISENNFNIKIIPGYNDYSSNILSPYLIKQELNEQFFLVKDQNSILLGYSSVIPFIKSAGYIDIETLNYLNEECKSIKDKLIYSFSNLPLSKVINKASLIKEIGNNKIIHFYPEENKFVVKNDFVLEIGFPGADKNNKPIYHLVENKNDSIFVIKKYFENENTELQFSESLNKLKILPKQITETKNINPFIKVITKVDYSSTSTTKVNIAENRIYVTIDNGLVYLIDFNGKEKFVSEIFGDIKTNPVLYRDLFLAATVGGDLYSLNSNNGEVIQVAGIGENITSDLSIIDLDKTVKSVVFGTAKGNILSYDAFTFEILWNKKLSDKAIISKAVYENDKIIFIDASYSVYCVNSKSGVLIWKYVQKSSDNIAYDFPLIISSKVFVLSPEGNVIALDLLQGKIVWSADIKTDIKKLYINKTKSHIFALNSSGKIFAVSTNDGKVDYSIELNKSGIFSFEIIESDYDVIIGLSDGSIFRISGNKNIKQIIEPAFTPITGLAHLNQNQIVVKTLDGKLSIIKIIE
jgi:outer membrane protein assembly factor BamB